MDGVTFHVIHSVKGGCGKTAFSLFTALKFAAEAEGNAEETEDKARVLLLDADFKGSGLKTLIYSKDQETFDKNLDIRLDDFEKGEKRAANTGINYFLFRKEYQKNSLNDYLTGKCHTVSEIVTESGVIAKKRGVPVSISGSDACGFNGYLDFIFCSSHMKDREIFSYTNSSQPALNVGKFRIKMRNLLEEICARESADGEKQYCHVVIDMPPGYDEYSDVLLDVLHRFCHGRKKNKICYYAVSTADRSHLDALQENVKKVLRGDSECGEYDAVCAVFSEVRKDEFAKESPKTCAEKYCADIITRITKQKCSYQEEYYDFCRTDRDSFGYNIEDV